ncbi:hypothetical protein QE152_g35116 [Popillia japonica]|uniref:Transposase n=1 Tax=Popillia japonica TaxID=7064 RepID=A0AAW1IR75_POPJA
MKCCYERKDGSENWLNVAKNFGTIEFITTQQQYNLPKLVVGNRTKCKQVFPKSWDVDVKPQAHSAAQAEEVGTLFPSTSTPAKTMEYLGFIIDHTGISKRQVGTLFPSTSTPAKTMEYLGFIIDHTGISKRHIQAKVKKQRGEEGD